MEPARLQALGLVVRGMGDAAEVVLELRSRALVNPMTRVVIDKVTFTILGDHLLTVDPPAIAGIPPVDASGLARAADLEAYVISSFQEHVAQLQRRITELRALGIEPKIDPQSLDLTVTMRSAGYEITIASDRQAKFKVTKAAKDGRPLDTSAGHTLDVAQFRERSALEAHLLGLFGAAPPPRAAPPPQAPRAAPPQLTPSPPPKLTPSPPPQLTPSPPPQPSPPSPAAASAAPRPVRFEELARLIDPGAVLPATSALELLVELEANGARYRFGAARISGRSFRGLLAGPAGKLWADQFELDAFPGARALLAGLLKIPLEHVRAVVEEG